MRNSVRQWVLLCCVLLAFVTAAFGQVPTGGVRGTVVDPNKAAIKGATVSIKNTATGSERKATTGTDGDFLVENLLPGEYEVKIGANGFKTNLATATVVVGSTLTGEYVMEIGSQSETVVISGDTSASVNTTDNKVDGVITRQQIDNLPLNGRNFLQLASLQPGVRVTTSSPGDANSLFGVSIGGASSDLTRLTVDGGSVVDYVTGGAGQNFSVETIQEFQISAFNFDLSTGVSSVGAVNVVSRTGTNDLHGSAFAYYRDRHLAAYPVLVRDPLNKEPFFRRLQGGGYLSGPIKKDKAFWFFNIENLNQDSTFSTVNNGYELAPGLKPLNQFNAVTPSPYDGLLTNARVDLKANAKNDFYVRYSGDRNKVFAPVDGNTLPSDWRVNKNDSYQGQGGWTWIATPRLVNDLRFNWHYVGNKSLIPTSGDCPNCLGLNGPQLRINGSNFIIGNSTQAPQTRALHRYETTDNLNWQVGNHRLRFGGTWERDYGTGVWNYLDPTLIVLHNPADVLAVNGTIDFLANDPNFKSVFGPVAPLLKIPLPASFTTPGAKITYQDILQLPVAVAFTGIGDGAQPPPFNTELARHSSRYRWYAQDSWTAKPGLTLSYGLSYVYETTLWNHDLTKPALLSQLYGSTNATPRDKNNFAPSVGFAWDAKNNAKMVVRGGFGMYYDTSLFVNRLTERALIGPLGNGRVQTTGDFFQNSVSFPQLPSQYPQQIIPVLVAQLNGLAQQLPPGAQRDQFLALANFLPGLALINPTLGTGINFQTIPTKFTGANFLSLLNQQIPLIQGQLNALGGAGVKGLDFFKQASGNGVVIDPTIKLPYSLQYNIGFQRELPMSILATVDFVLRRGLHGYFQADRNLFNRAASLGGPVIPQCASADAVNPTKRCTNGPVEVLEGSGRDEYKALLIKLDKRFSNRYAFTASYALSSLTGYNNTRDLTNLFGNPGALGADNRHLLTLLGQVNLPWGIKGSLISYFSSKAPFSAYLPGSANSDFNGDGTNNDLLPGLQYNQGNRGISESELRTLVDNYNKLYAGKAAPRGGAYPTVTLPARFSFGDIFQTEDLRLSKEFKIYERLKLEVIGEVFNLFNISNLGGYGQTLDSNFGQATSKAGQAFSIGGPRAIQLAARLRF